MEITLPLEKMSVEEKIQAMESIWEDLCRQEDLVPIPEWHTHILRERQNAYDKGEVEFVDWETAKKQIRDSLT